MARKQRSPARASADVVLTVRVSGETAERLDALTGGEFRVSRSAVARAAIEKGLIVMGGGK